MLREEGGATQRGQVGGPWSHEVHWGQITEGEYSPGLPQPQMEQMGLQTLKGPYTGSQTQGLGFQGLAFLRVITVDP